MYGGHFCYPVMFANIRFMSILCSEHSFHVLYLYFLCFFYFIFFPGHILFFAFFHEAVRSATFSKTCLLEKCVRKYTLLNPARACWCPFYVQFVRYASCMRSDCPVHDCLLSVTYSETFCLLNWSSALQIRYLYVSTVRSFGFSTGLTFLPPDNKNCYPFHVRRFNPVKCDRGFSYWKYKTLKYISNTTEIAILRFQNKRLKFYNSEKICSAYQVLLLTEFPTSHSQWPMHTQTTNKPAKLT